MTYSNDTERAAEDLVRDLRRHGYLECPDDAIVD